jgi:microcystin-dependent protein
MYGTPLPGALTGNKVQRLIEIDEALLYLVTGALVWLLDFEPLDQTGALTVENARNALSVMFYDYLEAVVDLPTPGDIKMIASNAIPTRWIECDGSAIDRTTYAKLFAKIGTTYGAGDGSTTFNVPDFGNKSPMHRGSTVALAADFGEKDHTLTTPEMPAHTHTIPRVVTSGAGANASFTPVLISATPTAVNSGSNGGGAAHNNVHPVIGVVFCIYLGE